MQLEKELISLDPHSFERIEDYMDHLKVLWLKLGECGKDFLNKDGQLTELVQMNLQTPYDVLWLLFHSNWRSCKEDGKDYYFDIFCGLLIRDQQKLLD